MEIELKELKEDSFSLYGEVLELPRSVEETKRGSGWRCWLPVRSMDVSTSVGIGIVESKKRDLRVDRMERHVSRQELLWPTNEPLVQVVAPPKDLENPLAVPDTERLGAFIVYPGQAILMFEGTWHSAAFPLNQDCCYYFAIEDKEDEVGDMSNPWVKLPVEVTVTP